MARSESRPSKLRKDSWGEPGKSQEVQFYNSKEMNFINKDVLGNRISLGTSRSYSDQNPYLADNLTTHPEMLCHISDHQEQINAGCF